MNQVSSLISDDDVKLSCSCASEQHHFSTRHSSPLCKHPADQEPPSWLASWPLVALGLPSERDGDLSLVAWSWFICWRANGTGQASGRSPIRCSGAPLQHTSGVGLCLRRQLICIQMEINSNTFQLARHGEEVVKLCLKNNAREEEV